MENSDKTDLEEEIQNLSHEDLCEITSSTLRRLLTSDKLLCDLPADVTTEEVNSQIAVVQGQSITVQILRNSETPLNVVIPQRSCTVRDLKKAIQRAFELKQQRTRSRSKISWHYVWRTYYLRHEDYDPDADYARAPRPIDNGRNDDDNNDDDTATGSSRRRRYQDPVGPVMSDDQQLVAAHGVRNKSRVGFVKRLRKSSSTRNYHRSRPYSPPTTTRR